MARRKKNRRSSPKRRSRLLRRRRELDFHIDDSIAKEIWAVLYLAAALLTYLSFQGNLGVVGELWKGMLAPVFGYSVHFLPVIFLGVSLTLFFLKQVHFGLSRIFGIFVLIFSVSTIIHIAVPIEDLYTEAALGKFGGMMGFVGAFTALSIFGRGGAYIVAFAFLLISILLTFQVPFVSILGIFVYLFKRQKPRRRSLPDSDEPLVTVQEDIDILNPATLSRHRGSMVGAFKDDQTQPRMKTETPLLIAESAKKDHQAIAFGNQDMDDLVELAWEFPPLELLSDAALNMKVDDALLKKNARLISDKLSQFGIEVSMNSVNVGPTVIQYTLKPSPGVKLSKITSLKSDLALALAAKAIRIEAPIPGQSMVGIEIPNDNRSTVRLREILESKEFRSFEDPLKLPIGRDVSGKPIVSSLAKMPHLLIAGATGSGKSVGVNSFLISLLYQYSPKDLKFIMIDPKRVELNTYNAIPHLLCPVITEPDKANIALRWCVREMNERYRLCAQYGHRNIADYNADNNIRRKLPFIVVVIDELADLMMTVGKEVEASVCRIAQMARAVGIHLILATQRPSVDVITGLIKANVPARIAFTVASQVDSRTIIDSIGSEDLLGHGDMLYLPGNIGRPFRVQGTFVSSKEIERVTNRVKLTMEPDYIDTIVSDDVAKEHVAGIPDSTAATAAANDEDNIYEEALKLVLESRKASASFLQRRLSIGYARAARLLDLMEQNGVVGPSRGAKAREVYTRE